MALGGTIEKLRNSLFDRRVADGLRTAAGPLQSRIRRGIGLHVELQIAQVRRTGLHEHCREGLYLD